MDADPCDALRDLCLGSPCVCLEGLVPDVSVCEHVCTCVHECVCTRFHGGHDKGPTKLHAAVACPSGPHASSAPGAERSPHVGSGENPVTVRSRDAAVSWGREVGTGHADEEADMRGTPVVRGVSRPSWKWHRQRPWPGRWKSGAPSKRGSQSHRWGSQGGQQ